MALSAKLELRQSQSLVMTPQLMQAIKLLQMSNLDLTAYVEDELERNPLLERDDAGSEPAPEPEAGDREAAGDGDNWLENDLASDGAEIAAKLDTELENVFPEDADPKARTAENPLLSDRWTGSTASGEGYNLEAFVAAERSLADHLGEQLAIAVEDPVRRLIGRYLIDCIDESGYLRTDTAAVAERLGASIQVVEETLGVLQGFEPAGVGARDLAECLALQLAEQDRLDPAMRMLVDNLDLVARGELAKLKRLCGVDDEDLKEMLAEIRALNPRPGNLFGTTLVQPVVPDVMVRAGPDGGWIVELNTETLPRVLVNQSYYAEVYGATARDADKTYLNECLQTANWLVKSLDQRARTILKVSSEIVRQQDMFFAKGVEHLRPLNLRTIADAIGMHESTVSRVTSN
ncbi:MAG: RNA polymerase factor sigma-54, partial [Hyphomicrobiales bacterium]|nr:RNA polymerase factor sigma-54 [Hyphomicrobiales bacterium]